MLRALIKFFTGPTAAEAYARGRKFARTQVEVAMFPHTEAERMYDQASGGFNTTEAHREFDRGVRDELDAQGYGFLDGSSQHGR